MARTFLSNIWGKRLDSIIDYDNKEKFLLYTDLGFTGWHIGIAVSVDTVMQPLAKW